MKLLPFIKTENNITVFIAGKPLMCDKKHYNYNKILELLKLGKNIDLVELADLFTMEINIKKASKKLSIVKGVVYYKDRVIDNVLTKRIISMIKEGYDVKYMLLFLDNLLDNPSSSAINELYQFMEIGQLPISKDGFLYAYKKVNVNFKDIHTNSFDNSVGSVVSMDRNLVDDNRFNTCSSGLHFCSYAYLEEYSSQEEDKCKIVVVKVNPKDVVSIPIDYNFTKARCSEYKVVKDVTHKYFKSLKKSRRVLEDDLIFDSENINEKDDYLEEDNFYNED